jgi:hypothetical protein
MRRLILLICAGLCALLASLADARADKRVALVIGNSAYRNVPKLPNPTNDATAVALLFKSAGFDVQTLQDLGVTELRRAIRDFSDAARDADMAVVFYAGHGIEVAGTNYLIPVDARFERDLDVEDESVSLDRVLTVMEPAKRLRLVILDACRDNPFSKSMKRTLASRSIGRGLARVEPVTTDTLIAFAAKAGSTAADGEGTHSPFTVALLQHLATPELDLRIAFGRVRDEVLKSTKNRQEPFVYGSLGGSNVALVSLSKNEAVGVRLNQSVPQEARDYEAAAKVGTKEAWAAFLARNPIGFYADLARVQQSKLGAEKTKPVRQKETASLTSGERKQSEKTRAARTVRVSADWCAKYAPNGIDPSVYRAGMAYPAGRAAWRGMVRACGFQR